MNTTEGKAKRFGFGDLMAFSAVAILIICTWALAWWWIDSNVVSSNPEVPTETLQGLFGDKFGAINSLFSGLAFAGVIFAVLMQRRELSLQREELRKSGARIEEQNQTLHQQRFENTFFKLLELHNDITSKLDVSGGSGRRALEVFFIYFRSADEEFSVYSSLRKLDREQVRAVQQRGTVVEGDYVTLAAADVSTLTEALAKLPLAFEAYLDSDQSMHAAKVKRAYQRTCEVYLDDFAHYFRSLYHVMRFLNDSTAISREAKKSYARIIRSQLSDIELVSIFYNAMMEYEVPGRRIELGYPKMGKLLVDYDMLQNMGTGHVIHPLHSTIFSSNNTQGVV